MRKTGFSLVELMIALSLMVFGIFVFLSVFSSSSRQSAQSRMRTLASRAATDLMEEMEAHPYGEAAPLAWSEETQKVGELWIRGRQQQLLMHKKIEFLNGSFVGQSNDNSDLVTITLSWRENVGDSQTNGTSATGHSEDNKEMMVQVPVWR